MNKNSVIVMLLVYKNVKKSNTIFYKSHFEWWCISPHISLFRDRV
jgi:hypothetical protein